ncbi:xanthine dehydrogenase family protein molybdopterin-binding subunit [Novosphingobium umbonatum]|uniref:Xanthine dehydrogenase family protein molybdopterin-binding subunit n=1 Tax=Novosphingobium umbonatum TaxID=1908524 RepID=A0A3S2VW05_9SPHN|nr:molybdopterin cofactor-binding domain-containing protein [Novosphingobium umbonatum]RVU07231.1 xanthine dehydrogenase family protein molybdopterin-binding subunit [Novosphingobium umbonatum]
MQTPDQIDTIPADGLSIHGARLSRRGFLGTGGALVVALGLAADFARAEVSAQGASLNAAQPSSWIEIHPDSTITMRTGKCDFGQSSIYTAYRQIVAEELGVPLEAITTVIAGDTDRTPDGGGTFGLLRNASTNMRKAAAYTREAVLALAAQRWGVARSALTLRDGVVSGAGHSEKLGALVAGQDLHLAIPVEGKLTDFRGLVVTGNPPMKAVADYTIVGQAVKNPILRPKVSGQLPWVGDIKLPGMLHARTIHPATLGSTLIAAGKLDTAQFPKAKIVQLGNLLAVVSPDEWEAVQAAQAVAADTKWSEWKGLPTSEKLLDHLQHRVDWSAVPPTQGAKKGDVASVKGAKTHRASYFMPYFKHAPIGPSVSLGDVKPDGSVTVHTHSQNPQFLRMALAKMLGVGEDKVVVRTYAGPGHFGRSNGGNAGSEDEAVLLSRALGVPVRVQWMRHDDMGWSTQSSTAYADISIALDAQGRIASYQATHSGPPMQDDRPIGAILAGLPVIDPPTASNPSPIHTAKMGIADRWVYGAVEHVAETGRGTIQLGEKESLIKVGLRDHSMRTPVQFQQNFPREVAMSEAAMLAGKDALQFRIDHTDDPRVKAVLERLKLEAAWDTRPSPAPRTKGAKLLRGRGVSFMLRDNGYWACAATITVAPATGEVKVERMVLVSDPGIVVNPLQLKRQAQAGCLMGVSQALHEEVSFDEGAVTSLDWATYPILTAQEMPDLKIVLAPYAGAQIYGQGSESANALAAPAIAGAFLDATGKPVRRLPLRPDYVKAALKA